MRCLLIGASMSMPSSELAYEDTWVYKIIRTFPDIEFIDKCRRSSSATRLVTEGQNGKGYDLLEQYTPDFVITHFGITDSYPRLLKRNSLTTRLINRLPRFISNFIYNIVRKTKGRTLSCSDLSPSEFHKYFAQYCKRAENLGIHVFCVKIAYCNDIVLRKSPKVTEAVDIYNQVFDRLEREFSNVTIITPLPLDLDLNNYDILQSDGIHLTAKGSDLVFQNILNAVTCFLKEQKAKK